MLETTALEAQNAGAVRSALHPYRAGGVDVHDCFIVCLAEQRNARVLTFDAKAAKQLGVQLLRRGRAVRRPHSNQNASTSSP